MAQDAEAAEAAIGAALRTANAVLRAHRVATQDPYGHEIGREAALLARVGFGTGEGLAEGRWEKAFEVPPPARRQRRDQALRPQERLAALLAGREPIDLCEPLLLRARADLDADRASRDGPSAARRARGAAGRAAGERGRPTRRRTSPPSRPDAKRR